MVVRLAAALLAVLRDDRIQQSRYLSRPDCNKPKRPSTPTLLTPIKRRGGRMSQCRYRPHAGP